MKAGVYVKKKYISNSPGGERLEKRAISHNFTLIAYTIFCIDKQMVRARCRLLYRLNFQFSLYDMRKPINRDYLRLIILFQQEELFRIVQKFVSISKEINEEECSEKQRTCFELNRSWTKRGKIKNNGSNKCVRPLVRLF